MTTLIEKCFHKPVHSLPWSLTFARFQLNWRKVYLSLKHVKTLIIVFRIPIRFELIWKNILMISLDLHDCWTSNRECWLFRRAESDKGRRVAGQHCLFATLRGGHFAILRLVYFLSMSENIGFLSFFSNICVSVCIVDDCKGTLAFTRISKTAESCSRWNGEETPRTSVFSPSTLWWVLVATNQNSTLFCMVIYSAVHCPTETHDWSA